MERMPSEDELIFQKLLNQIEYIKNILIWKTGRKGWDYVETVLNNLLKLKEERSALNVYG